jgi:hypothetical protein
MSLIIELTHPSGPVVLEDPDVRTRGEGVQLRAMIDPGTWARIRQHDIFGAATRVRQQGPLADDQPLRITVYTATELPDNPRLMPAEQFVILDAMNQVDLADSGLEGEIWEGVAFGDPQPWTLAITQLADQDFLPYDGLPSATTVRRSHDDISIEFRHHEQANVVHAQAVIALPMGDNVNPAVFQVVNGINAAMPYTVTMIDAGDLIVRDIIPDETGNNAPQLIASRVNDLINIITNIREPITETASGNLTPAQALENIFS